MDRLEISNYAALMTSRDALLSEIESFLKREQLSASDFGLHAVNDSGLITRLRSGKDVRLGTADKLRAFMKEWGGSNGRKTPTGNGQGRAA